MKTKHVLFVAEAVLLLLTLVVCWPSSPPEATIVRALSSTTVNYLSLEGAPPKVGVDAVLQALREQHPEMNNVRVFSHPARNDDGTYSDQFLSTRITGVELSGIPADEALCLVAAQIGFGCAVRDGGIYFYPLTLMDGPTPPPTAAARLTVRDESVPPLTAAERLSARVAYLRWEAGEKLHEWRRR